jgi:hypothetical protein
MGLIAEVSCGEYKNANSVLILLHNWIKYNSIFKVIWNQREVDPNPTGGEKEKKEKEWGYVYSWMILSFKLSWVCNIILSVQYSSLGVGKNWPNAACHLFLLIKFCWNIITSIHLCIFHNWFHLQGQS